MIYKPNTKYIDEAFNVEASENYRLSIQLSLDGFSFCVLDAERNKYIVLESYVFYDIKDEVSLCDEISKLVEQISWIQRPFKSVSIIYSNGKSTLIPVPLFDRDNLDVYANFNFPVNEGDEVAYDKLKTLESCNIYTLPVCIKEKLTELFSGCKIFHFSSMLIESLLIRYKNQNINNTVFANVHSTHFDITVIDGEKLVFYNSFNYRSEEDFIYYLIFVLEQLKLNPEEVKLILLGEIQKRSMVYDLLYKYIRNVSFGKLNDYFQYSYVFDTMPSHFFYNLLNVNLCE